MAPDTKPARVKLLSGSFLNYVKLMGILVFCGSQVHHSVGFSLSFVFYVDRTLSDPVSVPLHEVEKKYQAFLIQVNGRLIMYHLSPDSESVEVIWGSFPIHVSSQGNFIKVEHIAR